ncbi:hypothetical protein ABW14_06730 [Klebsiella michiganensis]|nr:hypothetical protein ABW14_06730 [Klebsiella michiganensis]
MAVQVNEMRGGFRIGAASEEHQRQREGLIFPGSKSNASAINLSLLGQRWVSVLASMEDTRTCLSQKR